MLAEPGKVMDSQHIIVVHCHSGFHVNLEVPSFSDVAIQVPQLQSVHPTSCTLYRSKHIRADAVVVALFPLKDPTSPFGFRQACF